MKKISIAICDTQQPYIEKLAEYFISRRGNQLQIATFTKPRLLAKDAHSYDVILMGDGFEKNMSEQGDDTLYISLSEEKESEAPTIFKYQSADEILRQIFEHYQQLGREEAYVNARGKEIIGIYSPCRSKLQTPFALTLAQVFVSEHRVLYLNLGEWSGFGEWFVEDYRRDLSDLLYMLSGKEKRIKGVLESVVHSINHLDYIPPMVDAQLLCQTSAKDYMQLLKMLVEYTEYETIILDFGVMVPGFFSLLDQCSYIYGVMDQGVLAQGQRQQFEAAMMRSHESLADKIEYVSFRLTDSFITEREAVLQQWLYGELGDRARAIRGMQVGKN